MKTVSLFGGIAGIDLGLETLGWEVAAFSEHDPKIAAKKNGQQYAADVFAARYPDAVPLGDISTLHFARNKAGEPGILRKAAEDGAAMGLLYKGPVDVISGGFPCQDISHAGKGLGIQDGTRSGLWRHYAEAIEGLRPRGVLIENVAALAGRGLDRVLIDLARIGYDCEWDIVPAAAVGAPHLRERMFILAWPAGSSTHGPWPTPPLFDNWLAEPDGIPRLITHQQADRAARLRCLGNAVVPQVAAWAGAILEARLRTEPDDTVDPTTWDARDRSKQPKLIGWAGDHVSAPDHEIAGEKMPRAGRMTHGWVYERPRSFTAKQSKARALAYMAPTLRPRPDDHPELPHEGLVPTPNASVANDGEGAETWIERKVAHATKGENATRASMPLAIYAQVKADPRLIPTPTAKDADSSRSRTAIRETPPARESQMGETLTDFVDPTNGGRLLATPCAADGDRATDYHVRDDGSNPTLQGSARSLLPTPTSAKGGACSGEGREGSGNLEHAAKLLPTPKATDGDKGVRSQQGAENEMARGKGGDLDAAVKLLPTPRVYDAESRGSGATPAEAAGSTGMSLSSAVHELRKEQEGLPFGLGGPMQQSGVLLPTPIATDAEKVSTGTLSRMVQFDERTAPGDHRDNRAPRDAGVVQNAPRDSQNGRLNPAWVEWVMGFPIGWSEL